MKIFRCPFEEKGIQDDTIATITLSEVQRERFHQLKHHFERFHRNPSLTALRLILPESLQKGVSSLEDLREKLLPYQAEIIAADLDDQLFPLLPHQEKAREILTSQVGRLPFDERPAKCLRKFLGRNPSQTIEALAARLLELFERSPNLTVLKARRIFRRSETLIKFDPSTLWIDGEDAKSTFGIVKTPYYPASFGRYSSKVELVLNRHLDVMRLCEETKRRIRRQANEVYAAHGVSIEDLDETQQPTGLWIPNEKYTLCL